MDTSTLTDFTEDPSTTFDLYTNDLNSQELIPEEPVTFSDYVIDAVTITNSTEEESGECTDIVDGFFLIFVIVSVCLTIVLPLFVVRRKRLYPNCLWGRPGILQPVNFIDEVYRRWAYAACFVLLTNDIMQMFLGDSKLSLLPKDDKEWMKKFGFVRVFAKLLDALAVSFVYYPLLACINHRRYIVANVIGILYLIPWIAVYSMTFHYCPINKEGTFLDSMGYVTTIPIYIAFYVIGLSYVLDLYTNIVRKRKHHNKAAALDADSFSDGEDKHGGHSISHHFQYVGNLLRVRKSREVDEAKNGITQKAKKVIKKAQYEKILGFRYSTRLVCCTTTAATMIIWVIVSISAAIDSSVVYLEGICLEGADLLNALAELMPFLSFLGRLCDFIHIAGILFHVSNVLSGVVVLILMVNTLVTYKQRWHQMLRGDHSWHIYGTTIDSPPSTLLNGLKYAGFQVAYAAWGWVVLMVVLWAILGFVAFFFIIPLMRGEVNSWFIIFLKNFWPSILLGIVIALIQKLICQFLFLQDRGAVLALNNRRLYNAASYYFLVLNVIIGIFACLKRIIIPVVLGILFLSRLDQPLIMRGYESKDPGYVSFVSMLLVDLYHNHPVVRAFVELMLKVRKQDKAFTGVYDETATQSEMKRRRSKVIRNRWWKTVTLANNPCLVLKALEQRLIDERNSAEQAIHLPIIANEKSIQIEMQRLPENHKKRRSSYA